MHIRSVFFFAALLTTFNAQAENVNFADNSFKVVGLAIAKSTSARLVNVLSLNPLEDAETKIKGVYIPAGTQLAILDYSYPDKTGRTWELASTQDGLLVFIKSKNKYSKRSNPEYFPVEILKSMIEGTENNAVAISLNNTVIETKNYGFITLTPSERYIVTDADAPEQKVSILIDKTKMGKDWKVDEIVEVPSDAVSVIGRDELDNSKNLLIPFLEYDAIKEAKKAIIAAFEKKDISSLSNVEDKVDAFLSGKFITKKKCEDEINYSIGLDATLAADLSAFISPVTANLSLTGKLSGSTTYPQNTEFDIIRVKRKSVIYEIKKDAIRENCGTAPSAVRISVGGSDKTKGEITGKDTADAGVNGSNDGSFVYHCRQEYFDLVDILVNKHALPTPISNFVVANFGEFKGAKDPAICAKE